LDFEDIPIAFPKGGRPALAEPEDAVMAWAHMRVVINVVNRNNWEIGDIHLVHETFLTSEDRWGEEIVVIRDDYEEEVGRWLKKYRAERLQQWVDIEVLPEVEERPYSPIVI